MKITKIISILLAIVMLSATLSSCVGFATAEKKAEWIPITLNVAVKYLIDDTDSNPREVDANFAEQNYVFEYNPADMPNPTALDVLEDYAYLEYDYKLTVSDGDLKSVGTFTSGSYVYEEVEYASSWVLNINGADYDGKMSDYLVKEGDTIIFYLLLIPRA